MIIGFDFDGVLCYFNKPVYMTLQSASVIELYYERAKPKIQPYDFIGDGDSGVIITGRHPDFEKVSKKWLDEYKITLPIYFIGEGGHQDWSEDNRLLRIKKKADMINKLGVSVYFEDEIMVVKSLRESCPQCRIIQVN